MQRRRNTREVKNTSIQGVFLLTVVKETLTTHFQWSHNFNFWDGFGHKKTRDVVRFQQVRGTVSRNTQKFEVFFRFSAIVIKVVCSVAKTKLAFFSHRMPKMFQRIFGGINVVPYHLEA